MLPSSLRTLESQGGMPVQSIQVVWDSTEPISRRRLRRRRRFRAEFRICACAKTLRPLYVYDYCPSFCGFRSALLSAGTAQLSPESRELEGVKCCLPTERTRNARVLRIGVAKAYTDVFR